jgi:hypothetical protein
MRYYAREATDMAFALNLYNDGAISMYGSDEERQRLLCLRSFVTHLYEIAR